MPQFMSRFLSRRVVPMITGALLVVGTAVPSRSSAQAQAPGVSLSTRYVAGQKTSLIVLPVKGVNGDSVATVLARDFDYSDRFNVVSTSSAPVVNTSRNQTGDWIITRCSASSVWMASCSRRCYRRAGSGWRCTTCRRSRC